MSLAVSKTRSGKLKTKTRGAAEGSPLFVRMTAEERKEFEECILVDADMHGGEANKSVVLRKLVRAFCRATRTIAASPEAVHAAKILRKKAGG